MIEALPKIDEVHFIQTLKKLYKNSSNLGGTFTSGLGEKLHEAINEALETTSFEEAKPYL